MPTRPSISLEQIAEPFRTAASGFRLMGLSVRKGSKKMPRKTRSLAFLAARNDRPGFDPTRVNTGMQQEITT
jgi:hypothetical protein